MNVEIRHLRQFLAVAEELHFSRAADRLHLAQPALSANIRKLEAALQLRLFDRSTRSVALTSEGQAFAEQARLAVNTYDQALNAAARLRGGGTGPVTLGIYPHTGSELKRTIVNRLREINPDVELAIVVESSSKLVDSVHEGRVDAALCIAPLGAGNLRRVLVKNEPLVAVLPQTHALAHRESIRLEELRDERWILPSSRQFRESSLLARLCADAGFTMQFSDAVSDFDDEFSGVAAKQGIEVVPQDFVHREGHEGIAVIPVEAVSAPIYLIARSEQTPQALNSVFQAIVEAAAEP